MADQNVTITEAEDAARLAILKKIENLASRTTSGTTLQQLSVAYRNVTTPELGAWEDDEQGETE